MLRSIAFIVLMLATFVHAQVNVGLDVLEANGFQQLQGKRVGLLCNPASVNGKLEHAVDVLRRGKGFTLVSLFGPEHGVYGDEYAGAAVGDRRDERTGLPIHSLYGATRKPTPQMLAGLDAVVFDLQDIGCRSYTFISSLRNVMEACEAAGVEVIVLDRPNPLGGQRVEGPGVSEGFSSFVSALDVPYVHGMTMGELANLIKRRHTPRAKLTVVKMTGWQRDMTWARTGRAWITTSPHIPHADSVAAYVATGLIGELGVVSNGVGYTLPFEVVGSPEIDGEALARKLPAVRGVFYRAVRFKPFYANHAGQVCGGVQVHLDPATAPRLVDVNLHLLAAMGSADLFKAALPDRTAMFDKVIGSSAVRERLGRGDGVAAIVASWQAYEQQFKVERVADLLY